MDTLRVLLVAVLMTFFFSPALANEAATAEKADQPPVLNGAVWELSPDTLARYTDEDLEAQVKDMHDLGMRVLIIRYIADPARDDGQEDYVAYISSSVFPTHPAFKDRKPFSAIFRAAVQHDMRVYLGGLPFKQPIEQDYEANIDQWSSPRAIQYRQEFIERYAGYRSFAGYYVPNTPDPSVLIANRCDPDCLLTATADVVNAVKSANPGLDIVMPIGLYQRPNGKGGYLYTSAQDLKLFWRPWVQQLSGVDTWMVIDGLGSRLSTLDHTAMAQRWARDLAHEFDKSYWTVVETQQMKNNSDGQAPGKPFSLGALVRSLSIATRFADQTIASDYLNAMGQQSPNPVAVRLHGAYTKYFHAFTNVQDVQQHTETTSAASVPTE